MVNFSKTWLRGEKRKAVALAALLFLLALLFMERALWPPAGQVLGGHDMRGAYYLWHETARAALRLGELPLWDVHQYAGFPFAVNPQVGLFYPPAWLMVVLPANVGVSWYVLFHIWLTAVGMLLFVRAVSGRWLGALLAAITLAFSGYLAGRLWAGHTIPLAVNAWLPWMLLGLYWAMRRRPDWPTAVLAGVPLALAILAGHVPSLLYVGLIWGVFALYWLINDEGRRTKDEGRRAKDEGRRTKDEGRRAKDEGRRTMVVGRRSFVVGRRSPVVGHWSLLLRRSSIPLIILAVGLALSAVQLLPLLQFMAISTRLAQPSFEFATDYSLPLSHLITLIIPDYFGEPTRAGYWSVPTFEELAYYAGVLPLLALLLALRRPSRLTWLYLILIVGGLWLALGRHSFLYRLFFDLLPPFRVVRAPARAAILYTFAASALLGEAIAVWQRVPPEQRSESLGRLLRWALAVIAVAGVAALAATGAVFAAQHPTDTSGRLWHQIGGWSLALVLLLAGGGLLWAYLTATPAAGRRGHIFAAGLVLLVTADMWFFSFKMVRLEPVAPSALWQDARAIVGDRGERVLPWGVSIFSQNEATAVGLRSIFGYGALEMAALEDFVASVPDPRATTYDILGAAYVIAPVPLDNFTGGAGALTLLDHTGAVWVYRRERAMPLARLVYQAALIDDRAQAIARVHEPGFDPVTTAILSRPPVPAGCELGVTPANAGTAEIIAERPGYWLIETRSDTPALLLLSESAYPGWRVTVNGRAATPLTAYSVIRAVCVPAGVSQVEWRFVPTIFTAGALISLPALLLVLVALLHRKGISQRAAEFRDDTTADALV